MKKIIYSLMFLIVILSSCKKKVIEGTFTIKGHFFDDCSKTPAANYPLKLRGHYYENNYPKYVDMASCTTDANGYFEFTYSNPVSDADIYITNSGIYPGFLSEIPIENYDSLNVYSRPTCNFEIKVNVINPMTHNAHYTLRESALQV